jgi:hypothetical protein
VGCLEPLLQELNGPGAVPVEYLNIRQGALGHARKAQATEEVRAPLPPRVLDVDIAGLSNCPCGRCFGGVLGVLQLTLKSLSLPKRVQQEGAARASSGLGVRATVRRVWDSMSDKG